jgi:hypothetical protein
MLDPSSNFDVLCPLGHNLGHASEKKKKLRRIKGEIITKIKISVIILSQKIFIFNGFF